MFPVCWTSSRRHRPRSFVPGRAFGCISILVFYRTPARRLVLLVIERIVLGAEQQRAPAMRVRRSITLPCRWHRLPFYRTVLSSSYLGQEVFCMYIKQEEHASPR